MLLVAAVVTVVAGVVAFAVGGSSTVRDEPKIAVQGEGVATGGPSNDQALTNVDPHAQSGSSDGESGNSDDVTVERDWDSVLSTVEANPRSFLQNQPTEPYGQYFEGDFSDVDGETAAQIFQIWEACRGAPRTQAEVERATTDLMNSRRLIAEGQSGGQGTPVADDEDLLEVAEREIQSRFERCTGTRDLERQEVLDLQARSVRAGFVTESLSRAWSSYADGDAVQAMEIFSAAWSGGSWMALEGMAQIHQQMPTVEFIPPELDGLSSDAQAYALMSAFERLEGHFVTATGPIATRKKEKTTAAVESMRDALLPHEVEAADSAVLALVDANKACCLGL